nr:uncharacterized protein LOC104090661 isoform X2 [Nicotiana tomentosiformis]
MFPLFDVFYHCTIFAFFFSSLKNYFVAPSAFFLWNKAHVDLYDLEEENIPNVGETFWREPNDEVGPSSRVADIDVRWLREDLPLDVIDMPAVVQHSQDTIMDISENEDDFDDTDWDWMEADD